MTKRPDEILALYDSRAKALSGAVIRIKADDLIGLWRAAEALDDLVTSRTTVTA